MIWITGDTHGDFRRFFPDNFPEQKEMTKNDIVLICGDFGGVWCQEKSKNYNNVEKRVLDYLESRPFTTAFVDGNHSNFDRLYAMPVSEWNGGKVHKIRPSVLHLMRGEIYNIDGINIFAFGGASSHDIRDGIIEYDPEGKWKKTADLWYQQGKSYRINHLSWWAEELPSEEEMQNGRNNLSKVNNKVDFIVTHSPTASTIALLGSGLYEQDRLTKYLEEIRCETDYTKWFCGHMHINKQVNAQDIILYEQIIRIH